jgi:hypothetical protein
MPPDRGICPTPMGNLFVSFTIAVCASIGLVSLSRSFDMDFYTSRTLPLIPILYAIVFEVLERRKSDRGERSPETVGKPRPNGQPDMLTSTFGRVTGDVAISMLIKFSLEIALTTLFLRLSGLTFSEVYGKFSIDTLGRFLRGEHPWLENKEGVYLLALLSLATCILTGLWIGYTTRGNAILEGVLAGAAVTIITSVTNFLALYRSIETTVERLAESMGYALNAGFLIVLSLQVLLYGLWSGLVQNAKEERVRRSQKRSVRKN